MESKVKLYSWQKDAIAKLHSGSILYGGVGSGKTLTSLVYYKSNHGQLPLYVITTAKKRDTDDWEEEAKLAGIDKLTIDSWNNIHNYIKVKNAFFIFDEQRAVGYGKWSKSFIKISRANKWIMLTASPGDTWMDYIPVFIANGFYRNKTDFLDQHVEFDRFTKFPKIVAFHNQTKLQYLRQHIIVDMHMKRKTSRKRINVVTGYDTALYKETVGNRNRRWNPFKDRPIKTPGEYTQVCRRLVGESEDRKKKVTELIGTLNRVIIFYNYEYERAALIDICETNKINYRQWNGKKHEEIPNSRKWVYIVQYTAGAEGWNCTSTDTMIFYSPNYSYKMMEQAEGRIDRLNTKYKILKYYIFQSDSPIDRAVFEALERKKKFNAMAWATKEEPSFARERISSVTNQRHIQTMASGFRA